MVPVMGMAVGIGTAAVGSGEISHPQLGLTTLTRVTSLSDAELDALVEQALVDAYDELDQHAAFIACWKSM